MGKVETTETIEFGVSGLNCEGCVASVEKALAAVDGVTEVKVSLEASRATVQTEPDRVDAETLDRAVREAGYGTDLEAEVAEPEIEIPPAPDPSQASTAPASPDGDLLQGTVQLRIEGMTCASCVSKVEGALAGIEGAAEASVNFATHRASLRADEPLAPSAILDAVRKVGYKAEILDDAEGTELGEIFEQEREIQKAEIAGWRNQCLLAAGAAILLMAPGPLRSLGWAHVLLGTVAQAGAGWRFYRGAWRSLLARTATMDTLIALSTSVAWSYGLFLVLTGGHGRHEFMTAAMILAFISLGKWLEGAGRLRAGQALRALLELAPATAHKIDGDSTVDVPSRDLVPGDRCRVLQGERVPADGALEGEPAELDEAMLTGESVLVMKQEGDSLFGGTVNMSAPLTIVIEKVGSATVLNQIARRVEEAQNTRPKMQALVDKVASVFVPVVIAIALVTALASLAAGLGVPVAISRAIAVLIVACPCAMGLATPLAVMAGVGVAARRGMIVRSAETLEISGKLDSVLFDKTGTLTEGKPEVQAWAPAPGHDERELIEIAASLEAENTHPLAQAIVLAAQEKEIAAKKFEGVEAVIGGGVRSAEPAYLLGSREFLRGEGVNVEAFDALIGEREANGETAIGVGVPGGDLIGALAIADKIKPGAAEAIQTLKGLGLSTHMISGDSEAATSAVAAKLGLDEYRARVSPEAKADVVSDMQAAGHNVAMVGDGINDAPALAQANLGVAVASGSDIAQEASGLVLLSGDPRQVAAAIRLARAVRMKMYQNLGWAFIYNIALIPVAAFGLLQPIYASGAMAASSVSVVANALLLYRRKS